MHDVTLTFNPASCLYTTSIWENAQIMIQMAYVLIFASLDSSSDLPPVGAAQYDRGYHYHGHAHNLNYFCATPLFLSSPLPLTNARTWHCTLILCLCHYCLSFSFGVDHHQSFSRDIPWLKFLFWFWRKTVSYYLAFESMSIYLIQHYIAIKLILYAKNIDFVHKAIYPLGWTDGCMHHSLVSATITPLLAPQGCHNYTFQ